MKGRWKARKKAGKKSRVPHLFRSEDTAAVEILSGHTARDERLTGLEVALKTTHGCPLVGEKDGKMEHDSNDRTNGKH